MLSTVTERRRMSEHPIKKTLIVAMDDALEGHDGLFDSADALVETVVRNPPRYNSPAASAAYFRDRTVEILDQVQLGLMLANADAVELLASAQRDDSTGSGQTRQTSPSGALNRGL